MKTREFRLSCTWDWFNSLYLHCVRCWQVGQEKPMQVKRMRETMWRANWRKFLSNLKKKLGYRWHVDCCDFSINSQYVRTALYQQHDGPRQNACISETSSNWARVCDVKQFEINSNWTKYYSGALPTALKKIEESRKKFFFQRWETANPKMVIDCLNSVWS